MKTIKTSSGVEIVRRIADKKEYAIVINHNSFKIQFRETILQPFQCVFYEVSEEGLFKKMQDGSSLTYQ